MKDYSFLITIVRHRMILGHTNSRESHSGHNNQGII